MRTSLVGRMCWRLELVTYDYRAANGLPETPSDDVVLVTIDELSMSHIGVWPWSREYHARVIDNLTRAGASFIGFDVLVSTVSQAAPEEDAANRPLDWEPPLSRADLALEQALSGSRRTVLAATIAQDSIAGRDLDASLTQAQFPHWRFEDAALGIGLVGLPQDEDGIVRRCPISRSYQDERLFSMPVLLAALLEGTEPEQIAQRIARAAGASGDEGSDDDFLISFRSPDRGFTTIPFYRVLRGQFSPEDVSGKIALLGATAQALQDTHNTPLAARIQTSPSAAATPRMAGVELLANALDTVLRHAHTRRLPLMSTLALACLIGALVALIELRVRPLWGIAAAWLPSQLGALVLALALWQLYRLWVPLVALSLSGTASYVGVMVYLELTSERQRRRIQQSWSRRVSPEVLQVILASPGLTQVLGRKLEATVLFTDLQGFTTFCHEAPPEVVVENLNRCLALVTRCVRRHSGTVHKFIGDGVMAVFGDPVQQPDHALRAIRSAQDMQQEMERLRANLDPDRWTPVLRVGIHTGELVAGDIGSDEMLEYTVIGDTVSTASRLEGLNKEYGTVIMVSAATLEAAGPGVPCRRLGMVEVRGRPEPMEVFAVDPWKPILAVDSDDG